MPLLELGTDSLSTDVKEASPFKNFAGKIEHIAEAKNKAKVDEQDRAHQSSANATATMPLLELGTDSLSTEVKEASPFKDFAGKIEDITEAKNDAMNLAFPDLQYFDPFALWSRRGQVSNETVSGVLRSVARNESCYKNNLQPLIILLSKLQ